MKVPVMNIFLSGMSSGILFYIWKQIIATYTYVINDNAFGKIFWVKLNYDYNYFCCL